MSLASFLQSSFAAEAPIGWTCLHEIAILSKEFEHILGFAPRADVLLENTQMNRRIWIEFEISRADPVANHMKFAVGHVFSPQLPGDSFVSMVSDHLSIGRMNLGASAVILMRRIGMQAFQIPLLPTISGLTVRELNHLPQSELVGRHIDVKPEIERAFSITEPVHIDQSGTIFFVSNAFEVSLNVMQWNQAVASSDQARLWGRRRITYFVYDPRTDLFAPSKYCAFLPILTEQTQWTLKEENTSIGMTMPYYCLIESKEPKFDGGVARKHFMNRLGYRSLQFREFPNLMSRFTNWLAVHDQYVVADPNRACVLIPPHFAIKSGTPT